MEHLIREFFWLPLAVLGMGIAYLSIWIAHKQQEKVIDVLKAYAEKGQEPPPAVLNALGNMNSVKRHDPAMGFAMSALYGVLTLGFAGAAVWLAQTQGAASPFVIGFSIAAFIMGGIGLCVLIYTMLSPRPRDER